MDQYQLQQRIPIPDRASFDDRWRKAAANRTPRHGSIYTPITPSPRFGPGYPLPPRSPVFRDSDNGDGRPSNTVPAFTSRRPSNLSQQIPNTFPHNPASTSPRVAPTSGQGLYRKGTTPTSPTPFPTDAPSTKRPAASRDADTDQPTAKKHKPCPSPSSTYTPVLPGPIQPNLSKDVICAYMRPFSPALHPVQPQPQPQPRSITMDPSSSASVSALSSWTQILLGEEKRKVEFQRGLEERERLWEMEKGRLGRGKMEWWLESVVGARTG